MNMGFRRDVQRGVSVMRNDVSEGGGTNESCLQYTASDIKECERVLSTQDGDFNQEEKERKDAPLSGSLPRFR